MLQNFNVLQPGRASAAKIRSFHWTDNENTTGFFWAIRDKKTFQNARDFCAEEFPGSDLAVGFTHKELKFLSETSFEEMRIGGRIHLGFSRRYNDPIFWSVSRGVPFGWSWAPSMPQSVSADLYVCLNHIQRARMTCNEKKKPFVCARYYQKPQEMHS